MLRMSRLTDYGIVLLAHLASDRSGQLHNARELADATDLPLPAVSKILKTLARGGFLNSHRGAKGGYSLAREAERISVAEVIDALDGPISLTECGIHPGICQQEATCAVRDPWQVVNRKIRDTLARVSISELVPPTGGGVIPTGQVLGGATAAAEGA